MIEIAGITIDPEFGGKAFAAAYLLQGLLLTQCPKQQFGVYGWSDNPLSDLLLQYTGTSILTTGILGVLILFYDVPIHTAVAYSAIVWLLTFGKMILNRTCTKAGASNKMLIIPALPLPTLVYGGLYKTDWIQAISMGVSVFWIVMTLFSLVATETYGKLWGLDLTKDKKAKYEAFHFGVFSLVYHAHKVLLLQGTPAPKAIGAANLIALAFFLDGYFGSKAIIKVLEKPQPAYIFWVVFFAVWCSEILIDKQQDSVKEEL